MSGRAGAHARTRSPRMPARRALQAVKSHGAPDAATNPIYVSVGHRIGLDRARALVVRCCKHRIPEPVRQADLRSRAYLRRAFPS